LKTCLQQAETAANNPSPELVGEIATTLRRLHTDHPYELRGQGVDAVNLHMLAAHANLLLSLWKGEVEGPEAEVLQLYAEGKKKEAVDAAIRWYQRAALENMGSLTESYFEPPRRISDWEDDIPTESLFAEDYFRDFAAQSTGVPDQRRLLRCLFAALGPNHEIVHYARAELEFVLDRKKHVPFHTRWLRHHKGGPPKMGRGTGKRSGYSKGYWLHWGPQRFRKNTKPMGGPHTDKED